MATIRLVHVSDVHVVKHLDIRAQSKLLAALRAGPNYTFAPQYSPAKWKALLRFLRKRQSTFDGIVITGDIATTGRDSDINKAFELIKHRLEPVGMKFCLLPGNHDRWVPHRPGQNSAIRSHGYDPGGKAFHSKFSAYWGPSDVGRFDITKGTFRVVVLTADFSLRQAQDAGIPQIGNRHGQGRVYPDILRELETETQKAQAESDADTTILWAIHFPPFCANISPHLRLLDEMDLLQSADYLGVKAILAGHSHVADVYDPVPFQTQVFCAGTVTEYNPAKNHFFVITLDDQGGIQRNDYEYSRLLGKKFVKK